MSSEALGARRRLALRATIAILAGGAQCPGAQGADTRACLGSGLEATAGEIVPWMSDQTRFLVSPDARQMLIKREIGIGHSELQVLNLPARTLVGRYAGEWPLLISWRPHSPWMSFVEDSHGDYRYRLKFWRPTDGRIILPNVPTMTMANRFLRWSPKGRYLVFPSPVLGDRDQLRLIDAQSPAVEATIIYRGMGISDFDWSPDGRRLAIAAAEGRGNIVLLDPWTRQSRAVAVNPGATLRQLAWLPDGRNLLVTCRDPAQTGFGLRRVDLAAGNSVVVTSPPGSIDLPAQAALKDGRILFYIIEGGLSKLMIGGLGLRPRAVGFEEGYSSLLAMDGDRDEVWLAHKGLADPGGLYRVGLDRGAPQLVYSPWTGGRFSPAPPTRVEIPVADGSRLSIYVWRAGFRPSRGVAVAFPVFRRNPFDITFDGANQYLVHQGYDYIAFDFRPTTYHGADWESHFTDADVTSALAVIDYARHELGAPPEKVVLYARSNSAIYLIHTVARLADKRGGLVLCGALSVMQSVPTIPNHRFTIAGLQGEHDPFPPAEARQAIEHVFGEDCLQDPRGFWRVMPGKAHVPRFIRSKAMISAAMLQLLAAPPLRHHSRQSSR